MPDTFTLQQLTDGEVSTPDPDPEVAPFGWTKTVVDYPDYRWVPRREYAKCGCGSTRSFETGDGTTAWLAFFESAYANELHCDDCGMYATAPVHNGGMPASERRPHHRRLTPHDFTPRQPAEHDSYYCGCRGWD